MSVKEVLSGYAADATAVGVVVGTLIKVLPPISAFISVVYVCIKIYETKTVQKVVAKWKKK